MPERNYSHVGRSPIEEQLSSWLQSYGDSILMMVPVLAFAEACIGMGVFVSGALLLGLAVFLYGNAIASVELIASLAMLGAFVGDHAGYYCGYFLGPKLLQRFESSRHRTRIQRAESFIRRFGTTAIFAGRFIPAIRRLVPALVGASAYSRQKYALVDLLACGLWAAALAGLVLGIDVIVF